VRGAMFSDRGSGGCWLCLINAHGRQEDGTACAAPEDLRGAPAKVEVEVKPEQDEGREGRRRSCGECSGRVRSVRIVDSVHGRDQECGGTEHRSKTDGRADASSVACLHAPLAEDSAPFRCWRIR